MAVAFQAATPYYTASSLSSHSWSHTVSSGSALCLIVKLGWYGTTTTGVTYNGVALTRLTTHSNSLGSDMSEIWYLKNPPVGAFNVVVSFTGARPLTAGAETYTGVHQTTTFDSEFYTEGSSLAPSIGVTGSATGDMVIDLVSYYASDYVGGVATAGAGQTETFDNGDAGNSYAAGSREAGAAGTVTMSWTLGASAGTPYWGITAVNMNASPPGTDVSVTWDVRTRGQLQSLDSRDIRLTGTATSNTTRDVRVPAGTLSTVTRDVRAAGNLGANTTRDVRLTGALQFFLGDARNSDPYPGGTNFGDTLSTTALGGLTLGSQSNAYLVVL